MALNCNYVLLCWTAMLDLCADKRLQGVTHSPWFLNIYFDRNHFLHFILGGEFQ